MARGDTDVLLDYDFISTLCHELRAPLFPIIALSDLILKQPDSASDWDTLQSHISMMYRSGQELLELVQDLHALSRLETNRTLPSVSALDFREFLTQAHSETEKQHNGTHDLIQLEFESSAPSGMISCDRNALNRIGRALLDLAMSHTPADNPKRLQFSATERLLCLGFELPLIDAGERNAILEPFWKPPWKISAEAKANGMKLHLVERWCKSLGGDCTVRSDEQRTHIEAHIPYVTTAGPMAARGRQGLLVSDDCAKAYQSMLTASECGYDVSFAIATTNSSPEPDDAIVIIDEACDSDLDGHRLPFPLDQSAFSVLDD